MPLHTKEDVGDLVCFADTSGFDFTPLSDVPVTESLHRLFPLHHVLMMFLLIDTLLCFLEQITGGRSVGWPTLRTGFHLPTGNNLVHTGV